MLQKARIKIEQTLHVCIFGAYFTVDANPDKILYGSVLLIPQCSGRGGGWWILSSMNNVKFAFCYLLKALNTQRTALMRIAMNGFFNACR